jgi:hypothetical protein
MVDELVDERQAMLRSECQQIQERALRRRCRDKLMIDEGEWPSRSGRPLTLQLR